MTLVRMVSVEQCVIFDWDMLGRNGKVRNGTVTVDNSF